MLVKKLLLLSYYFAFRWISRQDKLRSNEISFD